MNCTEAFEALSARSDGERAPDGGGLADQLVEHLARCPACAVDEEGLAGLEDLFSSARTRRAPPGLRARVLERAAPAPRFPILRRAISLAAGFAFFTFAASLVPRAGDVRAALLAEVHAALPRLDASADPERRVIDRLVARSEIDPGVPR